MRKTLHPSRGSTRGFTLIELMVSVLVASILLAVAIPTYKSQIRKSRRTDAKTALLDLAGREERYFNTGNAYSTLAVNVGYAGLGSTATMTNFAVGNGYYQVTISVPAANGVPAPSYEIVATPLTADQALDTSCATFTVDSTGTQTATTSGGVLNTSNCW